MLIYLKFWESDTTIKKLYQLTTILNGEAYDWNFKIKRFEDDKINCTGEVHEIIRLKVRDKLEKYSQVLYHVFIDSFKTQIRNSIAHSNYSIVERKIFLNNFKKNDHYSQIDSISFEQWTEIFHNTLVLHNELNRIETQIQKYYVENALKNGNKIEVLLTKNDNSQHLWIVDYDEGIGQWYPRI